MKLLPADIIITASDKGWLSKSILVVLNFFQKDEVRYQHTMLMVNDKLCIEALNKITFNYIETRMEDFKRFKVIRHSGLTDEQRLCIVDRAKSD